MGYLIQRIVWLRLRAIPSFEARLYIVVNFGFIQSWIKHLKGFACGAQSLSLERTYVPFQSVQISVALHSTWCVARADRGLPRSETLSLGDNNSSG